MLPAPASSFWTVTARAESGHWSAGASGSPDADADGVVDEDAGVEGEADADADADADVLPLPPSGDPAVQPESTATPANARTVRRTALFIGTPYGPPHSCVEGLPDVEGPARSASKQRERRAARVHPAPRAHSAAQGAFGGPRRSAPRSASGLPLVLGAVRGEGARAEGVGDDLVDRPDAADGLQEHALGRVLEQQLPASAARHQGAAVAVHAGERDEATAARHDEGRDE